MTTPIHTWVLIEPPGQDKVLAFTYHDQTAGLSAKGSNVTLPPTPEQLQKVISTPETTYRLPGFPLKALSPEEVKQYGLPEKPSWLKLYASEGTAPVWREDPKLKEKFHPRHPDDLKAIFFFPEVRRAEAMWVRLVGVDDELGGYRGILLNQPQSAKEPKVQSEISIRSMYGVPEPVYISPVMRENWNHWKSRCRGCGFDMLFEPVSELVKRLFPGLPGGSQMQMFTSRCLLCAETVTIEAKEH